MNIFFSSFSGISAVDNQNETVASLSPNHSFKIPLVDHDYVWLSNDTRPLLDITLSKELRCIN